jgi:RNA polymerase sigma-70 factor (sigma-E family)
VTGPAPDQFVRAHAAELLRAAMLLTGSQSRAEDLVQDTLTRLLPKWHRVSQAQSPLAYVRRSLVNRYLSQRRLMSSRDVLVWDVPEAAGRDVADDVVVKKAVEQLLAALPVRQRAAVVLRYYEDLPDAEIAAILSCRVATVRSMVSRALGVLRSEDVGGTISEEAR